MKCECCGKDVPYASLKDHMKEVCEYYPVACKYCNQMIPMKNIEQHESTICDEVPTKCEFQAFGYNYDKCEKIYPHPRCQESKYVMKIEKKLTQEFTTAVQNLGDRITAVRSNPSEKFVMLAGKLTGMERRIETQERRIESQEKSIESQERSIESQERRIESQERRIENLENRGEENRIASLERQVTTISTILQRMWESLDERGDLPEEPHDAREV
ncbi:TNF receptor-associated factor 3-like [Xenia sp. Carnegie-2017]|uniref:TNF receptor-associated factor 3-like n=1 Tax=Xenia sp. Carnegie-2017 TaxID=2897299 RepID=UPI001F04A408|nr:TNF receptor-associated factor 3-like [Xenia sp. Carnegie-2017]